MLDLVEYGPSAYFMLKTNQRARAFYYIFLSACFGFLDNFFKQAFHDPRPFWDYSVVESWSCSKSFGNPSGHAMWCMGATTAIALDIMRSNPHGKCMYITAFIISLCIGLSVCWTRVIMGAHSVDQVLFGSLIGLWLALTLEFIVRKWMMGHIMNLNKDRSREYLPLGILAFLVSVGVFILLAVAIYLFLYCEKYIKTIPAG